MEQRPRPSYAAPMSATPVTDADFLAATADRLAALPSVRAVALGGSRAQGTARPDSDWDLAIYYRGDFDPADLRAIGWEGEVSEVGGWGGGVFNGGAWLTIEGRRVDGHYRDLDVMDRELAQAREGVAPALGGGGAELVRRGGTAAAPPGNVPRWQPGGSG